MNNAPPKKKHQENIRKAVREIFKEAQDKRGYPPSHFDYDSDKKADQDDR